MFRQSLVSTKVRIPGITQKSRILHITDVHVCRPDEDGLYAEAGRRRFASIKHRDNAEVERRALRLFDGITTSDFDAVVLSGDLVDFLSRPAVEFIRNAISRCAAPVYLVGGNHDTNFPLSKCNAQIRAVNFEHWSAFGDRRPKLFDRWETGGVQFLGFDNSLYQIDAGQLAHLRRHLATGQPTVLVIHIPLASPRLKELTVLKWHDPILMGENVDEATRIRWNWDPPVPETDQFIEIVKSAKNLHAVLAGHVHFGHEEAISPTAMQLVGPPGFDEAFRIVEFEPL